MCAAWFSFSRSTGQVFQFWSGALVFLDVLAGTVRDIEPVGVSIADSIQLKFTSLQCSVECTEPHIASKSVPSIHFSTHQEGFRSVLMCALDLTDVPKLGGAWVFKIIGGCFFNRCRLAFGNWYAFCSDNRCSASGDQHRNQSKGSNYFHLKTPFNLILHNLRLAVHFCQAQISVVVT